MKSGLGISATLAFPFILPGYLRGQGSPSKKITIGCIGMGRMGLGDLRGFLAIPDVQVVAVCDVDRNRAGHAAEIVNTTYAEERASGFFKGCDVYGDFRELLSRKDIDAVAISTPDHWHAIQAIMAAREGKDIFVQKPLTYTIEEGRALSDAVARSERVLQVGSQQRSDEKFRFACELVRNGRIGKVRRIEVGFGLDPAGDVQPVMDIPEGLNYNLWLGPAPRKPYTEQRVHPQSSFDRPGWLRISDYCLGMITGWGSHHMDIAHWGMGEEHGGPVFVEGTAEFPADGIWDVHGAFHLTYEYNNGIKLICTDNQTNAQGVTFIGDEGRVYVRRGYMDAQPKSLLKERFSPGEIRLPVSNHHKKNFIACVKSRGVPVAPVENGHRSASACILGHIAMVTGEKLQWSYEDEQITNIPWANRYLSRPMRSPWKL